MKKTLFFLAFLAGLAPLARMEAQEAFSLQWHGFVNPHYYADSRSVVGGREDMMLFYPKPIELDSLGNDLNDSWQANMLAITARLGLRINGPDMLGAKTSGYIEGDFTGSTNATINNLRLRHAYIQMDWLKSYGVEIPSSLHHTLIVGQYWYPMVIHEIMPMTNPLNMGAPFHCYARQPQVRYEWISHGFDVVAAACWQLDNMSQGLYNGIPQYNSTLFARHSLVPELNLQLRYLTKHFFFGAAVNLKTIQPQVTTVDTVLQHTEKHTSFSWSLFGRYNGPGFTVKAQALLNNSLYEGCSLGGYLMLADSTFQDWHFNTVWLDVERNRGHWRPGLFVGYARNLDYGQHADVLHTFGRGYDMAYLWRVQPRLTYKTLKGLDFTGEVEYTRAGYANPVGNLRLSLSMVYAF